MWFSKGMVKDRWGESVCVAKVHYMCRMKEEEAGLHS